jgi:hypothetical protein
MNTIKNKQDMFTLRLSRNTGPLVSVVTSYKLTKILNLLLLNNK